jgi:hypothetical protein
MFMKRFVILLVVVAAIISGCHKKQNRYIDYNPVVKVSNDYVSVQQLTVRLLQTFFKITTDSLVINNGYNPDIDGAVCRYSYDTVSDSTFYRIKYGSWGVIDPFGKRRGGEILVSLDGNINDSSTSGMFVFKNFHYEYDSLSAQNFKIINTGSNGTSSSSFEISAGKMKWDTDSIHSIIWSFKQTYRQNGSDEFLIWGELSGTAQTGMNFRALNPEDRAIAAGVECAWLENGQMDFNWGEGGNTAQILFSDSTGCHNKYTLLINDLRFDGTIE